MTNMANQDTFNGATILVPILDCALAGVASCLSLGAHTDWDCSKTIPAARGTMNIQEILQNLYGVDATLLKDPGVDHIISMLQKDELPEALATSGTTHVYAPPTAA